MSYLHALFLVAALLCVLLGVGLFLGNDSQSFSPFRRTEGPRWDLWQTLSWLESEIRREETLEADRQMIFEASRAKDRIVEGLIDGQLLFAEAAARFRAVDAKCPPHLRHRFFIVPGASVEEHWANIVCRWARNMRWSQFGGEAVLARLATEREEYLAQVSSLQPTCTDE